MSAGSRKKHTNAHKQFGGGSDHLEVSALIAGAGNDRDVEERLGGAIAPESTSEHIDTHLKRDVQNAEGWGRIGTAVLSSSEAKVDTENASETESLYETDLSVITYVGQPIKAYVIRGVQDTLFMEGFNANLKRIIETLPRSIRGLTTGFQTGRFTNTQTRAMAKESEASFCAFERHGRLIDRTMHDWAERYNDYQLDRERSTPASVVKMPLDDVTVDVMFIETDDSGEKVAAAWLGKNLYPLEYSGIESHLSSVSYRDGVQVSFRLAGQYKRSKAVDEQAQALLREPKAA